MFAYGYGYDFIDFLSLGISGRLPFPVSSSNRQCSRHC